MAYDSETIAIMNAAQAAPLHHPFTCMRRACSKSALLVFGSEGWACPCGKYVCHGGEPTPANPNKSVLEVLSLVRNFRPQAASDR